MRLHHLKVGTRARLGSLISACALVGTGLVISTYPSAPAGATAVRAVGRAPGAGVAAPVSVPLSPVGKQLVWLLTIASQVPLSNKEIGAHFTSSFLSEVSPAQLNQAFEELGPPGSKVVLVSLADVTTTTLQATIEIGPNSYSMTLSVGSSGLIDGLFFRPVASQKAPSTWAQVDSQLASIAPGVSMLAAEVSPNGSCRSVRAVAASTARPLGSMFKLFVLGALAEQIKDHRVSWGQKLTVTAGVKVGGSGTLQSVPDGTRLSVQNVALRMISQSDNTAADMVLKLVGRAAVQDQVQTWSSHASLDIPFLTVSELFALKYHDFPAMADHYLDLGPSQRARYLSSTVDKVRPSSEQSSNAPRDIGSIEWFASADDLCRAFVGLAALQAQPGLGPLSTVMSTNSGGIALNAKTWPRIWFKGGSEAGVLTLGYLARDHAGNTFAVILLTEDPTKAVQEPIAVQLRTVDIAAGAFTLLQRYGLPSKPEAATVRLSAVAGIGPMNIVGP